MTPLQVHLPTEPHVLNLDWLVRLRFGSLLGQVATVLFVACVLQMPLPLVELGLCIALGLGSNAAALVWLRSGRARSGRPLGLLMVYDVLHLTALLFLTGGPFNPFSLMYLVLIALATVTLTERQVWALVVLSAGCSALLFWQHRPLLLTGGHAEHMRIHLYGMWVAFSVAACFLVYFLVRIRRVLAARDLALQEAQRQAAYKEKLASLATLAAGAAHELATPLSTIALVAQELEHHPELHAESVRADIALIRSEVARCRVVLDQMAVDAGQGTGDALVSATLSELLAVSCSGLPLQPHVVQQVETTAQAVVLPLRTLGQALRGLVKNAQEASPSGSVVVVRSWLEPLTQTLQLEVQDHGSGMSAEIAQRVGEPFFSTKAEGHGMGLGVFLCRAVVESLGGELQLTSTLGAGTRATVRIPVAGPSATCRLQPAAATVVEQAAS